MVNSLGKIYTIVETEKHCSIGTVLAPLGIPSNNKKNKGFLEVVLGTPSGTTGAVL